MSITSGALSKTFVVVSDTAPSSPFEGQLWRDTSTDVLKQWDGSNWTAVQTTPDDDSLKVGQNGLLYVFKPSTPIFGDFSSSLGTWTVDAGIVQKNDYCRFNDTNWTDRKEMYKTVDLTGIKTLKVDVENTTEGINSNFEILLDGTIAVQTSGSINNVFNVDVSGKGENTEIRIAAHDYRLNLYSVKTTGRDNTVYIGAGE